MTGHDAFAAKSDFWAAYIKCRPEYPNRLFKIIYDYHSSHSQDTKMLWGVAHDIGSGVGIAALEISRRFSHVIVSDPSSSNIESAKEYLSIHKDDSNFSFHIAPAETVGAHLSRTDLWTFWHQSEAIMWADHDESMNWSRSNDQGWWNLGFLDLSRSAIHPSMGNEARTISKRSFMRYMNGFFMSYSISSTSQSRTST